MPKQLKPCPCSSPVLFTLVNLAVLRFVRVRAHGYGAIRRGRFALRWLSAHSCFPLFWEQARRAAASPVPSGTLTVNGGRLNLKGTNQSVGNFIGSGGTRDSCFAQGRHGDDHAMWCEPVDRKHHY
jgi:hypothetical protein